MYSQYTNDELREKWIMSHPAGALMMLPFLCIFAGLVFLIPGLIHPGDLTSLSLGLLVVGVITAVGLMKFIRWRANRQTRERMIERLRGLLSEEQG